MSPYPINFGGLNQPKNIQESGSQPFDCRQITLPSPDYDNTPGTDQGFYAPMTYGCRLLDVRMTNGTYSQDLPVQGIVFVRPIQGNPYEVAMMPGDTAQWLDGSRALQFRIAAPSGQAVNLPAEYYIVARFNFFLQPTVYDQGVVPEWAQANGGLVLSVVDGQIPAAADVVAGSSLVSSGALLNGNFYDIRLQFSCSQPGQLALLNGALPIFFCPCSAEQPSVMKVKSYEFTGGPINLTNVVQIDAGESYSYALEISDAQ